LNTVFLLSTAESYLIALQWNY